MAPRPGFVRRALTLALALGLSLDPASLSALAATASRPRTAQRSSTVESTSGPAATSPSPVAAFSVDGPGGLPLYFVENQGQADPRVEYYARGSENSVFLTRDAVVLALTSPSGEGWALRLDFEGANPDVRIAGRDRAEAVVSYLKGRPSDWREALPTWSSVVYEDLWPGIDLVYESDGARPKYTFVVAPGADPGRIRLAYRGASRVFATDEGRLAVETPVLDFEEEAPYVYQEGGYGARTEVSAAYALEPSPGGGAHRFGFRLGDYDRSRTLFLDPTVLVSCGYIGGNSADQGYGIAVDSAGYVYVVGEASSTEATFPATPGAFDATHNGNLDAFVAKVKPDGTGLVYATYIGGSQSDRGLGMALDSIGGVFVTGDTSSTEAQGFPVVGGPDLTHNGGVDGFVAKLSASGTTLLYAGYIGGSAEDRGWKVARDSSGQAYVAGMTRSSEATFPVTSGAYATTWGGSQDGFVAKVAADGSSLVYSTYLGTSGLDAMGDIAVDASGRAHVSGSTDSSSFPRTTGPAHASPGVADAFVARFNSTGAWLEYSRFLGGSDVDFAQGLALDGSGNAYVTGQTRSSNFPRTSLQAFQGAYDVFVTKLDSNAAVVYSGLIGGTESDQGFGIAVDGSGNAYVTGQTSSSESQGFPVNDGPDLTFNGGAFDTDAFVAKVNAAGSALVYCGYIGGSASDYASGIAVDGTGQAYLTGNVSSTQAQGFPVLAGPDLTHNGGGTDAFVAKIGTAGLVLADHPAFGGQVGDQFTTTSPVSNAVLFRFELTAAGTVTVDTLRVRFTTATGVASGDVSSVGLYEDLDNDGVYDASDTLVQSGITPSGGVLTFTTNFAPSSSGTSYYVRATVSNLVAGDSTTLSLATTDVDLVEAGVAKAGSVTDAFHVQDYASGGDIYFSVGTSTADLKTGNPWVVVSNGVATLTVAQTGNVGVGDVLCQGLSCPGTGTKWYVRSVLSPTRFVVQNANGTVPANYSGGNLGTITRTYNTIAAAESGSPTLIGGTSPSDLATNNRRLTWVLYNDGPFTVSGATTIDGYITTATYYLTLTVAGASQVASGVSQRHRGRAGTGAALELQGTIASYVLRVLDPYTRVEWLEIDGNDYTAGAGIWVDPTANDTLLRQLLVHDVENTGTSQSDGFGIAVDGNGTIIRNCIIYEYGEDGIYVTATGVLVQNTTLYRSTQTSNIGEALQVASGNSATAQNVIATDSGFYSEGTLTCFNSISSDDSATSATGCGTGGTGNRTNRSAASLFVSVAVGNVDLHLKPGSDAVDTGASLGGVFTDDIDGQPRPYGGAWDVGADELSSFTAPQLLVRTGSYDGDGGDNRAVYVGFQPDFVLVDSQGTTNGNEAVVRTSTMAGDASKELDPGTPTALAGNRVQSFTATGFVVGSDPDVNESGTGRKYHWLAMQAGAGAMKVGTYVGNGTAQTISGLGFAPVYVMVLPSNARDAVQRGASMPAGFSATFNAYAWAGSVTSFTSDGFVVGSSTTANESGVTYHYVAWASVPGAVAVGSYSGNGSDNRSITGTGFLPAWVGVTRTWSDGRTGSSLGNAPVHKPASTGVSADLALLFNGNVAEANNIQALQLDGFQVGSHQRVNTSTDPNVYHWVAFGPHTPATNYRSIGETATIVGAGGSGVNVTQGSTVVDAPSATWLTSKRGRGDVIVIPCADPPTCTGGVAYTVAAVLSQTRLVLTQPYQGATQSGLSAIVRRQLASPAAWEDCIDGPGGTACPYFPPSTNSLVADDREEVGILYNDGAYHPGGFLIDGSVTDASHGITLTVDPGHRHSGVPHLSAPYTHAVVQNEVSGVPAIDIRDDHVTIEWLDVYNRRGTNGIAISDLTAGSNEVVVRQNLVRGGSGPGIWVNDADTVATISNNILASLGSHGIALGPLGGWSAGSRIQILNNTVAPNNVGASSYHSSVSSPSVLLRNNIAYNPGYFAVQFYFPDGTDPGTAPDVDPASSHNLSIDGTGTTHSPAGGGIDNTSPSFVNAGSFDYHFAGGSAGIDAGANLGGLIEPFDIDNEARVSTWDIGADEYNGFTAVKLAEFRATGYDSSVLVEWETAQELDNLGFHLYRGVSMDGPWERLNESLIPGLGSSPEGKRYSFLDAPLRNGATYYYRLEDLDRSGKVTSHGPVSATPLAGAGAPGEGEEGGGTGGEGPGEGESTPAGWTEHGDPRDVSLRVVSRDRSSVTFELRTGGFYSLAQEDGSVRLFVPGFFDLAEPGFPTLPTRRTWTEAVPGLGARVQSVSAEELVSFDGLVPPTAGAPEAVTMRDGTYQKVFRPVAARPLSRGLYPREQARVLRTAFQGDTKKAYLEFLPLRLDSARGRIVLARRILVTVLFDGVVPGETGLGGSSGRSLTLKRQPPADGRLIARFSTRSRGLHAVAWEDLLAAVSSPGLDLASSALMLDTASLRLSRKGEVVPFHVEPRPDRFVPGSTLFFLAPGPDDTYNGEAVFELAVAPGGRRMAMGASSRGRSGSTDSVSSLLATLPVEQNLDYLPGLLDAPDPWLWTGFLSGSSASYPFSLHGLAPGDASISVRLMGGSDTTDPQDHRVALSLNGTPLGEAAWDGMTPFTFSAPVPDSVLTEGSNTLLLEGRGSPSSAVYLDRFSLDHPRSLSPLAGSLEGTASHDGVARASGFDPGAVLLEISPRATRWLGRSRSSEVAFPTQKDHRYLAVSPSAFLRPVVHPVSLSSLRDPANRADWIAIAPRDFLPALEPLLLHRQAQGLATAAVAIEDVFAEFGFGETSPDALRDFLAFAYHHWASPSPRYVLLLADATYDPRGFFSSTSRKDLIPSPFVRSTFLWTPSDPLLASVNGDDLLPDLALGRLPASTLAEASDAVQKILDFENAGRTLLGDAVLVADNPDAAGDFEANANDIASLLPSRSVRKVFLTQYGSSTKAQVLAAFDSGPSLVSYVGHGSASLWANSTENVLRSTDVPLLQTQPQQPLLLTMTCSNGYFVSPWQNSISERLALAPDKGSIAAFSPSGLSLDSAAHLYHRAVVTELEAGNHHRLGDLLLAAQASYTQTGAFPELLAIYHLFADPALKLR